MSNEEFQRKMDFIVEQQAQFASDMQVLRESQAQLQATQVQTEQVVARLAYVTLEGFKDVNAKIDALVDAQIKNEEKLTLSEERINARMDTLIDAQIRTEESLRNLTETVDRHINESRNGH